MPAPGKPVTIRGVTYRSQTAAAKALGVSTQTVYSAKVGGYLDNVGLHQNTGIRKRRVIEELEANPNRSGLEIALASGAKPSTVYNIASDLGICLGGMVHISITISRDQMKWLEHRAAKTGTDISGVIAEMVKNAKAGMR